MSARTGTPTCDVTLYRPGQPAHSICLLPDKHRGAHVWSALAVAPADPLRGIPAPVALADHGDACADCGRVININEPVFRAASGGVRCAGCDEAVPEPTGRAERFAALPAVTDLVTSVLMRRAAYLLSPHDAAHVDPSEARIVAHELRERAALLQEARDRADANHRNKCEAWPGPWDLLRAIGEVRS